MTALEQRAALIKYTENTRWFLANFQRLRDDPSYQGRFVAVARGEVIASHDDLDELLAILESPAYSDRASEAVVEFIRAEPVTMLL